MNTHLQFDRFAKMADVSFNLSHHARPDTLVHFSAPLGMFFAVLSSLMHQWRLSICLSRVDLIKCIY